MHVPTHSALEASVLVLNKMFLAVHVISVRRAFCLLCKELAEVVTLEDGQYMTYDFETWREVSATGSDHAREAAAQFLAGVREVAALEALRANAKAVELLTGRRWYVMKSAREGGATWAQIGEALGITKQAAHDFYRRKIEEQEKYLPDLHNAVAARAVLEEGKED